MPMVMESQDIRKAIRESLEAKEALLSLAGEIEALCRMGEEVLKGGGKLLFCGNGGSACDAAHASCELTGWFLQKERRPLPAVALGFETPALTAMANDKGYDEAFARQVQALGRPGDLLVGITTSGRSPSVVRALERARSLGIRTAVLTGREGGPAGSVAEFNLRVPSSDTPRIQECHLLVLHIFSQWLEAACA